MLAQSFQFFREIQKPLCSGFCGQFGCDVIHIRLFSAANNVKLFAANTKKHSAVGISSIEFFKPDWVLPNSWYQSTITRKFVKHTGIRSRSIALIDEAELAVAAIKRLVSQTNCNLNQCAGFVFASPSFIPMGVASQLLDREHAKKEQLSRAVHRVLTELDISPRKTVATNSFCSGYAKAMTLVQDKVIPNVDLQTDEFVLVVTSTRISRITDFGCRQTGALFGDLATVTLISRVDSARYPVHFELVDSRYEKRSTNRPFFAFEKKRDVVTPTLAGGQWVQPERVVFSLDGMGIADVAPRAMAESATEMAESNHVPKHEVRFIVPHQAGSGIVRLAGMKLQAAGFEGDVVNGLTENVGNVSSGSVPYALKRNWDRLAGTILCPVAAVGAPGKCEVSQGCILLSTTLRHQAAAA